MIKEYRSKGFVYGRLWGGREGSYPARRLNRHTKIGLLAEAKKALKVGWLDSGMGYEYLFGALLEIEEIETIEVNNKEYTRSEYETVFIGDLTEKQKEHLLDQLYS